MKRTPATRPIPIGQFITQTWRVPIKPPRRSVRTPGANGQRRLVRPGESHAIVCDFCGNTIKLVICAMPATAIRGGRR